MKKAFTMIELIFVIVILGILAAVALPKFASTKKQADIAAGRADVATIRAAIVNERQTQLIIGVNSYISRLSTGVAGDNLFTGNGTRTLLLYGIATGAEWDNTATTVDVVDTYTFTVDGVVNTFNYYPVETTVGATTYQAGTFNCTAGANCSALSD